jgi:hypothetical protein
VANDVRGFDVKRIKNADHITDYVMQGIRGYSFGAIGAPEATQVRCDYAEAVLDEKLDLIAPKVARVWPPVQQEHWSTTTKILNVE